MTIQHTYQEFYRQLQQIYDSREAANITDWVIEHVTGLRKIDRVIQKSRPVEKQDAERLKKYLDELLLKKPVQYVLEEAWFGGMRFMVNENVLIPRPETEELVEWVAEELAKDQNLKKILDIGTGSGCIPITLKRKFPGCDIMGIDISDAALEVAKLNAKNLGAEVLFQRVDIFNESDLDKLPRFDIIVSNPPYIPLSERDSIPVQVEGFEPHVALFVKDDPLVFYRRIAILAEEHLSNGGWVFVETHEERTKEVARHFRDAGFRQTEIRRDMQGKERMVKAGKMKQ